MPSLLPLDAQEAWAAQQKHSIPMGPSKKLEMEVQLKRQKALLSQVKNGVLKLPDGGEKIRVKIRDLEGALMQSDSTQRAPRSLPGENRVQEMDTSQNEAPGPARYKSENQTEPGASGQQGTAHMRQESDSIAGASTSACEDSKNVGNSGRKVGLGNGNTSQKPYKERPSKRGDTGAKAPSVSCSGTSSDPEQASRREELSRKSESAGPSVRHIEGREKSVRLRSGSLEPMHTKLPSDVVRGTVEKIRAQMAAEVDATADKLGQMLTIEEDGTPMDVGPTDGPLSGVRERNDSGNSRAASQSTAPRATKFIGMQEAAELERRQAEAQREVEDRILARRPPLYCGPGMVYMGEGDDNSTDESEHDMSDSEDD